MLSCLVLLGFLIGHFPGPYQISVCISCIPPIWATCTPDSGLLGLTILTTQDDLYKWGSSCYVISQILASYLLGVGIFVSSLFWNAWNLCSFLQIIDHASQPQKITGYINNLNIFYRTVLVRKMTQMSMRSPQY